MQNLVDIFNQFNVHSAVSKITPLTEGHINRTFEVKTKDNQSYILQRKNKNVFVDVPAMMGNIAKVTNHIKEKARKEGKNELLLTITHIETKKGSYYTIDSENEYWTLTLKIPNTSCYVSLTDPKMIYSGANTLATFQNYLSDFGLELHETIPHFHDICHRFSQWNTALQNNNINRVNNLTVEIEWIESRRNEMLCFANEIKSAVIPKRISHNDTKPSNTLFNKNNEAICLIDLDTVMSSHILYDFGDAIRTHANTGKEDDNNLNNVNFNFDLYKAYTEGYLNIASNFLTESEVINLAMSAKYICYEQILRFLTDYINGDTYYKIDYPSHNLVRTHAQYKLLQSMENQFDNMQKYIIETIQKNKETISN